MLQSWGPTFGPTDPTDVGPRDEYRKVYSHEYILSSQPGSDAEHTYICSDVYHILAWLALEIFIRNEHLIRTHSP
jgi:hypothetical protein